MLARLKCNLLCRPVQLRFTHSSSVFEREAKLSNGRSLLLSTGKLSKIADGACVASIGDTHVLVTAVSKNKSGYASFVPLTVDYREKAAAGGRIPTNYLRRELAPSDREILTGRLIDRSVRTCFAPGYFGETQITCNLLSVDSVHEPDVAAINAASAALALSDIPWFGPVAAVRVSLLDNQVIINPTRREMNRSACNLVVTTRPNRNVIMMEGACNQPITLNELLKLIKKAQKETQSIIREIQSLVKHHGKTKRTIEKVYLPTVEQIEDAKTLSAVKIRDILTNYSLDKLGRDHEITALRDLTTSKLKETYPDVESNLLLDAFVKAFKQVHCELVLEGGRRADGRGVDEVRPLRSEVCLYKPLHGSALFQRGQTQVLATVAFDSPDSCLRLNSFGFADEVKEKKFMLHYEFPKYATNDIGRSAAGRREIGHGALAEKSLRPLVPNDFPFTIRLTAEVLESNGSSSMASVCAGSMALMDAGVKLEEPVAGVAMGLLVNKSNATNDSEQITDRNNAAYSDDDSSSAVSTQHRVLTDITGFEDFYGEMDFKVSGTRKAFTALHLDCKLMEGVPMSVLMEALVKAHEAKAHILSHMNQTIRRPAEGKQNWPVLDTIQVPVHKRGAFVGPNGMHLKKLKSETGVTVLASELEPEKYNVFAPNQEAMNEAHEFIDSVLKDTQEPVLDFGGIYTAEVTDVRDNGVLIRLHPNMKPVLLHNRELDRRKVSHPSAIGIEVGQQIQVKYFGRDPATGDMRISRRVLQMSQTTAKDLVSK